MHWRVFKLSPLYRGESESLSQEAKNPGNMFSGLESHHHLRSHHWIQSSLQEIGEISFFFFFQFSLILP